MNVRVHEIVHATDNKHFATACGTSFQLREWWHWADNRPIGEKVRQEVDCMACIAAGVPP